MKAHILSLRRLILCRKLALSVALILSPVAETQTEPNALRKANVIRVATFNSALHRNKADQLQQDLQRGPNSGQANPQITNIARIIRHIRPDIILLNEFDYREDELLVALFKQNYLESDDLPRSYSQYKDKDKDKSESSKDFDAAGSPIKYAHHFLAPSNTGIPSGVDFNNDGNARGEADVYGYGSYPGQYGMLLLSRFPIVASQVRTFQKFLWRDMPQAKLPIVTTGTGASESYYSEDALSVFRLSSKSHWDIPVDINGEFIHVLASHPTPPVFDGIEDRNGLRNHDEIRFWADYVAESKGGYIYDDNGNAGPLAPARRFILLGDLNASADEGDSTDNPMQLLLHHDAINGAFKPVSKGGQENSPNNTFAATHTASWALRADYVLPSRYGFQIVDGAVFWPAKSEPSHGLVKDNKTDHRLVWLDLQIQPDSDNKATD